MSTSKLAKGAQVRYAEPMCCCQDAHGNSTDVPVEQLEELGIDLMALQPDGELLNMPELAVIAEMVRQPWPQLLCNMCRRCRS